MQLSVRFLGVAIALLFSLDAIACGDSMYRVGKNVSYRVYTAPLPGSVLVYGQSEGARQLAEALARSGHGVRYVQNEAELESELSSGSYDVVIASYSEHDRVEANSAGAAIRRSDGYPVYTVNVGGLRSIITAELLENELGPKVLKIARKIEEVALGML